MRNPSTVDEWKDAVNLAEGAKLFYCAKAYGLITGGPEVNVERCAQILQQGAKKGIFPRSDAGDVFLKAWLDVQAEPAKEAA